MTKINYWIRPNSYPSWVPVRWQRKEVKILLLDIHYMSKRKLIAITRLYLLKYKRTVEASPDEITTARLSTAMYLTKLHMRLKHEGLDFILWS